MTTPLLNSPYSIIDDAMHDCGKLQRGVSPNSSQVAEGYRKLTDIINYEQTQGQKLWLLYDLAVTVPAATDTVTFGPSGTVVMAKPTRVIDAWILDVNLSKTPLNALAKTDWDLLPTNVDQGTINSYYVNKQAQFLSVQFWPTPLAATDAVLVIQRQVTNFTNVVETMNFPVEWRIFLRWALADEYATGQPPAIQAKCTANAERYRAALEDWDVEDPSVIFGFDTTRGANAGFGRGFR